MGHKIAAYQLRRSHDGKVLHTAVYCKYFLEAPNYCALFREYPADQTEVILCRRVPSESAGKRECRLFHLSGAEENEIGSYVKLSVVSSEQEAIEKAYANIRGQIVLQNVMEGRK